MDTSATYGDPLNESFVVIFCDCYAEYVRAIETLNLKNRNLLECEISPSAFLAYHNPFKSRILNNDVSVLSELTYLNHQRCASTTPANRLHLLMFLSNLCIYAKLATKPSKRWSDEEIVMSENISSRYLQQRETPPSGGAGEFLYDICTDIHKDLSGMLTGETDEFLRREMSSLGSTDILRNPMQAIDILKRAPNLDLESFVGQISSKIAAKMESGSYTEADLMKECLRLMTHVGDTTAMPAICSSNSTN